MDEKDSVMIYGIGLILFGIFSDLHFPYQLEVVGLYAGIVGICVITFGLTKKLELVDKLSIEE